MANVEVEDAWWLDEEWEIRASTKGELISHSIAM